MSELLTGKALVEAAQAGDRGALENLIEREQERVYRFSMKMCRDPDDAEDVLQETLLAVTRNVESFRGASSFSTWLYTIARSFCVKKRRKSKFAPEREESFESVPWFEIQGLVDPSRGPEEVAAGRQLGEAIDMAIAALTPADREVLVLRDVEGLTAPEVAEVTGSSVSAVKSRLHRARVAMRERLAPIFEQHVAGQGELPETEQCRDVALKLSQRLEGDLDPELCAAAEAHAASCPRCRAACDAMGEILRLCRISPTGPIPDSVRASVKRALAGGSLQRR